LACRIFGEADLGQRAALAGQRDYRVGAGDNNRIARFADTGRNREFNMRVCRAPVVARQNSNRMPTRFARAGRRRFHHARAPAVDQHGAAASDLATDRLRKLAHGARRVTSTDDRYHLLPFHFSVKPPWAELVLQAEGGGEFGEIGNDDVGRRDARGEFWKGR